MPAKRKRKAEETGKLRIGDTWNAITIIALSQNNPLKAIAEFVENSIDANAKHITITRGREKGEAYLRVKDDGEGIPQDPDGVPDFKYVATHICDSIKKELKARGATGIQGEFGIGLLSFWTVGEALTLTSAAADGHTYQMRMVKDEPGYTVTTRRFLFPDRGTELEVRPLLAGIRQLTGEKIQWYLASELRDRIRRSGAKVQVIDRPARKQFTVEPRQFTGRLLHNLPKLATPHGDVYVELYLSEQDPENKVALCRSGTRVLESITRLDRFSGEPWSTGFLAGILDAPFLNLTPGTRDGVIQDGAFLSFFQALGPLEDELRRLIEEQREAEEQRASRQVLKSVQRALREALLALPADEYDWFDVRTGRPPRPTPSSDSAALAPEEDGASQEPTPGSLAEGEQKQFFECEGPLFSVCLSPRSCVIPVGEERGLRAIARDRSRRAVERDLSFEWRIVEGEGSLSAAAGECVTYKAPAEPCLVRIEVTVRQGAVECRDEALLTVTDSLVPTARSGPELRKGLPGYTFHRAPGELWRSRYDTEKNVIVINNGHRDFVYASRNKARRLRYICRLFTKELVCRNFPGIPPGELLERMVELSLYTEENLR